MTDKDFDSFEKKINISFNNKNLLIQAFVHRSYLNENRTLVSEHNERLEFLGDAVLELVSTEYLYKKYPAAPEGELTAYRSALVNAIALSKVAADLGVNELLLLSRGEAKDNGRARQYILADTLEAIIGAIYLDQGYDKAKDFIEAHVLHMIDSIIEQKAWLDAKSFFQEVAQEKTGITPLYKTLKEMGPDHDKEFSVGVFLGEKLIGVGEGRSKQEAEQEAAKKGLAEKGWLE